MEDLSPYEQLRVKENASFEEIQEAKKRLSEEYKHDSKILENIEAAYDSIIMERLRLRQEGKIKVPEGIRFPDKTVTENSPKLKTNKPKPPAWLEGFLDTPEQSDILQSAGLYLGLSIVSVFVNSNLLSLLMALAFGASIYFLNRKEQRFGRSILITLVGLFVGIALGSLVSYLLIYQAGISVFSNDQISSIISFLVFWLITSFLR